MKEFHSTLSRRDFMKSLGVVGAGLGTISAAAPVFHDLDEVTSSAIGINKNPWWVKERDFKNPTVPMDWPKITRNIGTFKTLPRPTVADFENAGVVGGTSTDLETPEMALTLYDAMAKEFPGWTPGYAGMGDVRTTSLCNASKFMMMGVWPGNMEMGGKRVNVQAAIMAAGGSPTFTPWLGPQLDTTTRPQDFGAPVWQGTPEENLKTCRTAIRFFGGSDVAALELDDDILKFIHSQIGGKDVVVEDVDEAYETATKMVIPRKCKWVLMWSARQSLEGTRRQAGITENFAVWYSYSRFPKLGAQLQEFIRGLGYQSLNPGMKGYLTTPLAVFSGMGEHGRMSSPTITPKYGVTNRAMWALITDLPLLPTPPIDFGAYKFCKTCGICADACPFGLIQQGDPTWENPASAKSGIQQGTFEGWRTNTADCPHCPTCQGTCPFNSKPDSFIHAVVKGTVANTPLLNSFFTNMEKAMDYGRKDPEEFWNLDNDFTYGIDTSY
ncbi:MAG: hypothetical protein AMXMBFR85_05440 [Dehalococcoides mccartyi]